ncbi:NUDIX hydrolase [Brachybacterium endophyticum]|uniref:NUDIX hydrolase n=1 Tax=Brachybacterium endophyticum TaxID=2182385 RepID=UPI001F0BBAFC|nr:CoA pyrophosphatase [Brachybacterium endophyticum]
MASTISPTPGTEDVPGFLRSFAEQARSGSVPLAAPRSPGPARPLTRRSAVLLLVTGEEIDQAQVVVEERGHRMRSQPGQFALPGGGVEPEDADVRATALREAQEETGLDPEEVRVLGEFAPIPMPWRGQVVHPVAAWAPHHPALEARDPLEVERVVRLPLIGEDSLTDRRCRFAGRYDGRDVGPVFSLSDDRFVWGFTAMLLEGALGLLGLEGEAAGAVGAVPPGTGGRTEQGAEQGAAGRRGWPRIEIPLARRREDLPR